MAAEEWEAVYGTQLCKFAHGNIGVYTRRGDTLYTIIYYRPGEVMTVGGAKFKVKSAKFLASGKEVTFTQKGSQLIFSGLPKEAPDFPVTIIAAERDAEPIPHALSSMSYPPSQILQLCDFLKLASIRDQVDASGWGEEKEDRFIFRFH